MSGDRFTGHGFRRGGATHAFRSSGSLDRVQMLGRWACARTCKSYIDEALSERADLALSATGKEFVARCEYDGEGLCTRTKTELTLKGLK